MDIKEIKQLKQNLENQITQLIGDFEKVTNTNVTQIQLSSVPFFTSNGMGYTLTKTCFVTAGV